MRGLDWRAALGLPPTFDDEGARHRVGIVAFYIVLIGGMAALLWGMSRAS